MRIATALSLLTILFIPLASTSDEKKTVRVDSTGELGNPDNPIRNHLVVEGNRTEIKACRGKEVSKFVIGTRYHMVECMDMDETGKATVFCDARGKLVDLGPLQKVRARLFKNSQCLWGREYNRRLVFWDYLEFDKPYDCARDSQASGGFTIPRHYNYYPKTRKLKVVEHKPACERLEFEKDSIRCVLSPMQIRLARRMLGKTPQELYQLAKAVLGEDAKLLEMQKPYCQDLVDICNDRAQIIDEAWEEAAGERNLQALAVEDGGLLLGVLGDMGCITGTKGRFKSIEDAYAFLRGGQKLALPKPPNPKHCAKAFAEIADQVSKIKVKDKESLEVASDLEQVLVEYYEKLVFCQCVPVPAIYKQL
jgi:hypothetical protein